MATDRKCHTTNYGTWQLQMPNVTVQGCTCHGDRCRHIVNGGIQCCHGADGSSARWTVYGTTGTAEVGSAILEDHDFTNRALASTLMIRGIREFTQRP